jgi:hypothetical protein
MVRTIGDVDEDVVVDVVAASAAHFDSLLHVHDNVA